MIKTCGKQAHRLLLTAAFLLLAPLQQVHHRGNVATAQTTTTVGYIVSDETSKCVDFRVEGRDQAVEQATCDEGRRDNQQFTLKPQGTKGWSQIVNTATGLCIIVDGKSFDNEAKLIQYPCREYSHFMWQVNEAEGTIYVSHSKQCLALPSMSTSDGNALVQTTECSSSRAKWRIKENFLDEDPSPPPPPLPSPTGSTPCADIPSSWTAKGKGMSQCVALTSTDTVCIAPDGQIWRLEGNNNWILMPGRVISISHGKQDGSIWGVNSGGMLYRLDSATDTTWSKVSAPPQASAKLVQVSGLNYNTAVFVDEADSIWYYVEGSGWRTLTGKLRHVSFGSDGSVWGTNSKNSVYRAPQANLDGSMSWQRVEGDFALVDAQDYNVAVALENSDGVWYMDVNKNNGKWTQLPGKLQQVSISRDGVLWGVNRASTAYTAIVGCFVNGSEERVEPQFAYANLGSDGSMQYPPFTSRGDRIPDFSYAGYGGGGVKIPSPPNKITLYPDSNVQDNRARIQQAIDSVSNMPLNADGYRGAVLLKKGQYNLDLAPGQTWSLKIPKSGVVLRGEGMWDDGTVLNCISKTAGGQLIVLERINQVNLGQTRGGTKVVDDYLPVNFISATLEDASSFFVGQDVVLRRVVNQKWIDAIGATEIERTVDYSDVDPDELDYLGRKVYYQKNGRWWRRMPWEPGIRDMYWRVITKIEGNKVTFDVPIPEFFSLEYGEGQLFPLDTSGLLEHVGFEDFRITTDYVVDASGADTREHLAEGIHLANVRNGFARRISGSNLHTSLIFVLPNTRFVTVEDGDHDGIPAELINSGGYYGGGAFPSDGQSTLVQRCFARNIRHYGYVVGARIGGPIVILDSDGADSSGCAETHHRWSPGVLFDRIGHASPSNTGIFDRGGAGSGHGWTTSNSVLWNNVGHDKLLVQSPPSGVGNNFGVGGYVWKADDGDGPYPGDADSYYAKDSFVKPSSLYLQQLQDRLGIEAVRNVAKDWQIVGRAVSPVLELTSDGKISITPLAGYNEVRYTLDGTTPTKQSTLYTSPFSWDGVVMAIAFDDVLYPSSVVVMRM